MAARVQLASIRSRRGRAIDRFGIPSRRLLGLPSRLLASQITAHLWRTAGIALALTIGLGLYVSIQVWGYSMLHSFMPGPWAPDALLALPPGLDPAHADAVQRLPGVVPGHALPLVFEQPRLKDDLTRSAERATVTRQDTRHRLHRPAQPSAALILPLRLDRRPRQLPPRLRPRLHRS